MFPMHRVILMVQGHDTVLLVVQKIPLLRPGHRLVGVEVEEPELTFNAAILDRSVPVFLMQDVLATDGPVTETAVRRHHGPQEPAPHRAEVEASGAVGVEAEPAVQRARDA